MTNKTLPREVNTSTGVLPGFAHASELLRGRYEPPPQQEEEPVVVNLRDALDLFQVRIFCLKVNDVKLEGDRIGAVFERPQTEERYLVLFKREFYYRFSNHFPKLPSENKGYGMLANIKLVHWCALEGIKMAAIMPDGKCYVIDGLEFWRFYEKYKTDSPHIKEEIASPLNMWSRLF